MVKIVNQSLKPPLNQSIMVAEARVLQVIENHHHAMIVVEVKRQVGCGQMNCCSNLFKDFFKPSSKITLPLSKKGEVLKKQGYFNEKKTIKLAINDSWLIGLVISFYLLPLLSFLIGVFITNAFTSSPILLFLSGIFALLFTLLAIKKILAKTIHKQLKLLF